jgi:hypothetical protein
MHVKFLEGYFKIQGVPVDVTGMVFRLVEEYKEDVNGIYVTVDGTGKRRFPQRNIRIRVQSREAYEVTAEGLEDNDTPDIDDIETDDEIKARLRLRFKMLDDMTNAAKNGNIKAVIVSGPPGVGKSFGVEQQLAKSDLFNQLAERRPKYDIVKGVISPLGLYVKLYAYQERDNVLVFDDCDDVFNEEDALNILKSALDSSKRRTISWNKDSRLLRQEGIPNKFDFKGSVIFITNLNFANVKSPKIRAHLDALESRCHYVDLTINTMRDKMLRIKQIVEDGMLREYDLEPWEQDDILEFIDTNKSRLRELSLRMVLKLADLRKSFGNQWQDYATVTCMKPV